MKLDEFVSITNELKSNPVNATKILCEYRELDYALDDCKSFLQVPGLDINTYFQAANILQYVFLKKWNQVNDSIKGDLENVLYAFILNFHSDNASSFLLTKVMQIYTAVWKHNWSNMDASSREVLFKKVQYFITQSSHTTIYTGFLLLRTIVEEFCNHTPSQVSLPVAVHNVIRISFENDGLDTSFNIAFEVFRHYVQIIRTQLIHIRDNNAININDSSTYDTLKILLSLVKEISKTINEILTWEFYSIDNDTFLSKSLTNNSASNTHMKITSQLNKDDDSNNIQRVSLVLPTSWITYLLQHQLLQDIIDIYYTIRTWLSSIFERTSHIKTAVLSQQHPLVKTTYTCLHEFRLLLTNITSISGKFSTSKEDYMTFSNSMISLIVPFIMTIIPTNTENTKSSKYFEEDFYIQERQHFISLVLNVIGNYSWEQLSQLTGFESLLDLLYHSTTFFLQELCAMYDHILHSKSPINNNNNSSSSSSSSTMIFSNMSKVSSHQEVSEYDLIDGWRGDILTIVLECWKLVLEDSWLMSLYLTPSLLQSYQALLQQYNIVNMNSTHIHALPPTITPDIKQKIIMVFIKSNMTQLTSTLFRQLYELLEKSVLYDLYLSLEDDMENQEDDDVIEFISSRTLYDLMSSISILGRASFVTSFQVITTNMSTSIQQAHLLLTQCGISTTNPGMNINIALINDKNYKIECLKLLEIHRIHILLLSHLLFDDYSLEQMMTSETPLIPVFIMDAYLVSPDIIPLIYDGILHTCEYLKLVMYLLSQTVTMNATQKWSGKSHPLYSPLLIQLIVQLFTYYCKRYVNIDASQYDDSAVTVIQQLNMIHQYDDKFKELLKTLCILAYNIVLTIPGEKDVISAVSDLISMIATVLSKKRMDSSTVLIQSQTVSTRLDISYIIGIPEIHQLYTIITDKNHAIFSLDGVTSLYQAMSMLVISAHSQELCQQICMSLYQFFEEIHTILSQYCELIYPTTPTPTTTSDSSTIPMMKKKSPYLLEDHQPAVFVSIKRLSCKALAGMRGLARCQFYELEGITNGLFTSSLPIIPYILHVYASHDDMMKECLLLLRDVAEVQLPYMSVATATTLYTTSLMTFQLFKQRFASQSSTTSTATTNTDTSMGHHISNPYVSTIGNNGQESELVSFEQEYKNEILLYCVELLNHLVTKDLSLSLEPPPSSTLSIGANTHSNVTANLIPYVLLTGLEIVMSVITADVLKQFPLTSEKYFTFLTYLISAYEDDLANKVIQSLHIATTTNISTSSSSSSSSSSSMNMLEHLLQHILWAAGCMDSNTARLGLQALQWLATYQYRALSQHKEGFGQYQAAELFHQSLLRLFEILMIPHSSEYGLTMDRVDAYGNAVAVLIALNVNRFHQSCELMIRNQPPSLHGSLYTCFEKFLSTTTTATTSTSTSNSGVYDFTNISKVNRLLFVKKFRAFVMELRSIVVFV